jgi:Cu+-exporting ATPase
MIPNLPESKDSHPPELYHLFICEPVFYLYHFTIAAITAAYWWVNDVHKLWPAVTAIFIIACPCALLLSNTFTNGNILTILGRNHLYLRNAQVIEDIANADCIVFDKTGYAYLHPGTGYCL